MNDSGRRGRALAAILSTSSEVEGLNMRNVESNFQEAGRRFGYPHRQSERRVTNVNLKSSLLLYNYNMERTLRPFRKIGRITLEICESDAAKGAQFLKYREHMRENGAP